MCTLSPNIIIIFFQLACSIKIFYYLKKEKNVTQKSIKDNFSLPYIDILVDNNQNFEFELSVILIY